MYCKNCGKFLNQGELFCTACGVKVETEPNYVADNNATPNFQTQTNYANCNYGTVQNPQYLNRNVIKKSNWKSITSLVIGVISLILVFIFQIFTIPLSIVGLVFGILSLKDTKVGFILNAISLALAVPLLILYSILLDIGSNPTVGTWDCKAFNNGYNDDLEYLVTMKLDKNNKFKWSKYNDEKNNYVIGEYEFVDLHKTNNSGSANYYSIVLNGDEFVNNGVLQTQTYTANYEMGISKDSNEAVLMNITSYNLYACYRRSE